MIFILELSIDRSVRIYIAFIRDIYLSLSFWFLFHLTIVYHIHIDDTRDMKFIVSKYDQSGSWRPSIVLPIHRRKLFFLRLSQITTNRNKNDEASMFFHWSLIKNYDSLWQTDASFPPIIHQSSSYPTKKKNTHAHIDSC